MGGLSQANVNPSIIGQIGLTCTPTGTPPGTLILAAGAVGLLLLPGNWKLLAVAIAAYGTYSLSCNGGTGVTVGAADGSISCQWTTKSSCIISL